MDSHATKTINDLVKEAIESIANDNPELEIPTQANKEERE
jgi:hypothetical protein